MQDDNNKRNFSRVDMQLEAELTVEGKGPIRGQLHDVSMNGMSIVCESDLQAGDTCGIEIFLGSPEEQISIHAKGSVVRALESSLSLAFDSIDAEGFVHLQNVVRYNAKDVSSIEKEFDEHMGIKDKKS